MSHEVEVGAVRGRPAGLQGLRRLVVVVATMFAALAGSVAFSTPAEAATVSCGGGRCTVWLSNAETRQLGSGSIPAVLYTLPPPLNVAAVTSARVHVWIARQYGSWGWCSGFRLSVYPWETQGYFGYRC
jgi:hypothetical protein